jgi:hypothetical protein
MVTNSGAESRYFDQLSGVNWGIFPGITFGNHHEGSIPFTRGAMGSHPNNQHLGFETGTGVRSVPLA